jgi:hypothetical protein
MTFAAFLEFCYIARRNVISEDSLTQLKAALQKFHASREVFAGTARVLEEGSSPFSLPRQHSMVHYEGHIKNFGAPNGLCSSITESKHITAVKRPWRRSNKHAALPQILRANERLDKLAAARADFTARGMLTDSCLVQAIKTTFDTADTNDEDTSCEEDSDDTESDTSDSEMIGLLNSRYTPMVFAPAPDSDDSDMDADTNAATNAANKDANHSSTSRPPTPPDDNDSDNDNECGPVEQGPLMNEVRLVSKKGL